MRHVAVFSEEIITDWERYLKGMDRREIVCPVRNKYQSLNNHTHSTHTQTRSEKVDGWHASPSEVEIQVPQPERAQVIPRIAEQLGGLLRLAVRQHTAVDGVANQTRSGAIHSDRHARCVMLAPATGGSADDASAAAEASEATQRMMSSVDAVGAASDQLGSHEEVCHGRTGEGSRAQWRLASPQQ